MNIHDIFQMKQQHQKISMLTCYDYSFAKIINKSDVDMILVGDSAAMVMHGYSSTLPIDVSQMRDHVAAVARGAPDKFIVADMPFLSYRKSLTDNMNAVAELMKAGAHAIKLEGCSGNEGLIRHIVDSGVPVMGHLGLTPQSVNALGGYKVQAKSYDDQQLLIDNALKLQKAGCFALVMECVPESLAKRVTEETEMLTIGIGAGKYTDGQVLVMQDMLGMSSDFSPKFVRKFLNAESLFIDAFNEYNQHVKKMSFPDKSESFS